MSDLLHKAHAPKHVSFMVITVSDTRTTENDTSGNLIQDMIGEAGHGVARYSVVKDDADQIKAAIMRAILAAARGAMDNGFPWVALGEVRVLERKVSIELFATDENPDRGAGAAGPAGDAPRGLL